MKRKDFRISPYILIPVIFSGISILAVIVTYRITSSYMERNSEPVTQILYIGGAAVLLSVACSYLILTLILKPITKFVRNAERLPVLAQSPGNADDGSGHKDIEHLHKVLGQVTNLLGKVEARELFPEIIGQSRAMRGIFGQILKVAPTDSTVLISGESGTGKELVATSLYEHSLRKGRPFVKINCVAIPEGLLESELFGHEKGAFTGAIAQKKGKFELADGGAIFLDEIGDMPSATQAKLLRVLQEKEFERVGGAQTIRVDIRFITATNKNLPEMVKTGAFREDLFYRLNVFPLYLPPLRERREDIPFLIENFLERSGKDLKISQRAMQIILGYGWPGNIRELSNVIERAAIFAEGTGRTIDAAHLPAAMTGEVPPQGGVNAGVGQPLDERLMEIEKGMIIEAINRAGGVQARAAQLLGINPRSLWHRIKKYQIDVATLKKLQDL
ncbi:MAG: sigma-54 dependent transcriptional regulator [Syntrophales bacterium]|nr:sigma-54 dependent transcriptional regulator [Syntrophales bacterium]